MYSNKRQSISSPSPLSPSAILRPHSVTGQARPRQVSDSLSQLGESSDSRNVRVVLRIRPNDPDDPSVPPRFRSVLVHPTSPSEVRLDVDPAALAGQAAGTSNAGGKRHPTFAFEHVLGEEATQTDLYDVTARDVVDDFLKGHNVTFLAYGQTSSGKSYSMGTTGDDIDYSGTEFTSRTGLIPRTVHAIFEQAEETRMRSGPGASWECRLSFLELYNEEIIDLLSGTGIAISIREERDGRIVWSGVREVKVKSLAEVMNVLQDGSARRKTGETSMNASSSRSHAIFSLTLVQKKRSGFSSLTSVPAPPETPTRQLRRPSSTIGLVNGSRSPTPSGSRAPPSSFTAARPGMARPNSVALTNNSDDFVITNSKFNMVDLAGSERLKRTAAQGDRMKEGISINSGLLALGNVISTLADSNKGRGHIPYRDSKLTRMLQDSIGGNSLTTMIACVSPIEANIGETINTIKYASRARNIRNTSKINQVEAGWDDVDHLQATVTKLRKQLAALGVKGTQPNATSSESMRQSEKLVQRLAELQREHTELYDRYLQKCSDNIRLTSELRDRDPGNGDGDALATFNETVEPVILEYEKVVSALNTQLDELRGELSTISDLYQEQTRQLQEVRELQVQSESYVEELRHRIAKLTERNSSSEAYVQDLETKLKLQSDKDGSHADVIEELRKDVARLRDDNATLSRHTSELEARLGTSESRSDDLAAQVMKQEREAEHREAAYRDLEAHIALLDTTKDNKILLEELEKKDLKIVKLEQTMDERLASEERDRSRLLEAVEAEKSIQAELRLRLAAMQTASITSSGPVSPPHDIGDASQKIVAVQSPLRTVTELTPPDSPRGDNRGDDLADQVSVLRAALQELSVKYNDTESKYLEAENQIAELRNQISERLLDHAEMDDVTPSAHMTPTSEAEDDLSDAGTTLQTPQGASRSSSPAGSSSGRPESTRISSSSGKVAIKGSGFQGGRGYGGSQWTRPQSLSQELSSAQSSLTSPRTPWGGNSLLLSSPSVRNAIGEANTLRSSQSLEAELKFVHRIVEERDEVLKDREAYIRQLEEQLQTHHSHTILSRQNSATSLLSPITLKKTPSMNNDSHPIDIPTPPSPLLGTPTEPVAQLSDDKAKAETTGLSPKSIKRYSAFKDSLSKLEHGNLDADETQRRIDELVKEMTEKELSQRRIIEQQFIHIADLQKANNRLKDDQAAKASFPSDVQHSDQLDEGTAELDRLQQEHANELRTLLESHQRNVDSIQSEHLAVLDGLNLTIKANDSTHQAHLDATQTRHAQAVIDLESAHSEALKALQDEQDLIAQAMESSMSQSEEQRRQLKMKADQALFELSRVRDEHVLQRSSDAKALAEFSKAHAKLEKLKVELETGNMDLQRKNAELSKRIEELEQRHSKRLVALPPQGPPPTTPLPPIPRSPSGAATKLDATSPSNSASDYFQRESLSSNGHSEAAAGDKDTLVEKEGLKRQKSAGSGLVREAEAKLQNAQVEVNSLKADLREAQKTNSKLRAHLEDVRQEARESSAASQEHMVELDHRRQQMSKLSKEETTQRDSLQAATAQVANLRAQLERATDVKVNKKMNSRLKCF